MKKLKRNFKKANFKKDSFVIMENTQGGAPGGSSETPTDLYKCADFEDIAKCFATLHANITKETNEIKQRVSTAENKIEQIEHSLEFAHSEIRDVHEKCVPNLEEKIQDVENSVLKLELWGRKWNLIVRGIDGNLRETTVMTENKVKQFFLNKLNVEKAKVDQMNFQAVHRIPSGDETKRAIIVRFVSLIDRDMVLSHAIKNLKKGCGFSVVTDLPKPLVDRRFKLLEERKTMSEDDRKKTKIVYLREPPFIILKTK